MGFTGGLKELSLVRGQGSGSTEQALLQFTFCRFHKRRCETRLHPQLEKLIQPGHTYPDSSVSPSNPWVTPPIRVQLASKTVHFLAGFRYVRRADEDREARAVSDIPFRPSRALPWVLPPSLATACLSPLLYV